jgi:hypothetical protein
MAKSLQWFTDWLKDNFPKYPWLWRKLEVWEWDPEDQIHLYISPPKQFEDGSAIGWTTKTWRRSELTYWILPELKKYITSDCERQEAPKVEDTDEAYNKFLEAIRPIEAFLDE